MCDCCRDSAQTDAYDKNGLSDLLLDANQTFGEGTFSCITDPNSQIVLQMGSFDNFELGPSAGIGHIISSLNTSLRPLSQLGLGIEQTRIKKYTLHCHGCSIMVCWLNSGHRLYVVSTNDLHGNPQLLDSISQRINTALPNLNFDL